MNLSECFAIISRCDSQTGSDFAGLLERQLSPEGYLPPMVAKTDEDGRPRPASPADTKLAYARQFAGYARVRLSKANRPRTNPSD